MEITEEKLYAAFGLDPNGEKDSDVADQNEEDQEEQEQEPETETGEEETEPVEEETEPEEQTEEQRRENAARRRKAEQEAAIKDAVEKALQERDAAHQEEMNTFFQKASLINPFTKEPITNMEEFNQWRKEQDDRNLQRDLQSGKLTKETLENLIDERTKAQQKPQEEAEEDPYPEGFEQEVERQLAEIRKKDPTIKTLADIAQRPYFQAFRQAVDRGNNFVDAFYLATREQETEATAEAARQSAMNNLNGKKHLKQTSIGGKAGATISTEEREMYKLFNPKATDAEIQRFQNKVKKA